MAAAGGGGAEAQQSEAGLGPQALLTLGDVVAATLSANPTIQAGVRQVAISRGAFLAAGGPFDLQLQTSVLRGHDNGLQAGATGFAPLVTERMSYSVGAEQLLRTGVLIAPQIAVTRTALPAIPQPATGTAAVTLNTVVPLLRDRAGAVTAASERAARSAYDASGFELRYVTSQSVYGAVVAYWDYLAALRRLAVYQSSEARAQRMVEDTRILVEAEERTAADLTQVQANLVAKRAVRISAEQAVVEAREQLGLAMGVAAADVMTLPAAGTDFPPPSPDTVPRGTVQRWVDAAAERRADFTAGERNLRAARELMGATESDTRPQLDLVLSLGYQGFETGPGVGPFFAPLYRNVPGLSSSVELRYQFGVSVGARGRAVQQAAAYEQQQVAQQDLARRIATGVRVAAEALQRGRLALRESEEAVGLYQKTVDSEQRKFQLGVSTLFDVIQAQDGLTNAMLSVIAERRGYAVAIATLRFETGTLLAPDGDQVAVQPAALLTPP